MQRQGMFPVKDALILRRNGDVTQIIRADGTVAESSEKPLALLDRACMKNGSTAQGRMASFRALLGVKQKAAVLISEVSQEIWFPTLSMNNRECEWVCFSRILSVRSIDDHASQVTFASGVQAEVGCGVRTLRLQIRRCRRYLEILSERVFTVCP